MPSIEIPNASRRDFDDIFKHLSNFGRWGTDPLRRFIVANWSCHTVVRVYAKDASTRVTASPQLALLFLFGLIPIFVLATGLIGLPGFGRIELALGSGILALLVTVVSGLGLEMAVGMGTGWLLWRVLLVPNVLEQMAMLLIAPTPTQPNVIPMPRIQRIHIQRAHLLLIVFCTFLEKLWCGPARNSKTVHHFSLEGSAWLSRQFGELITASLLGIVEASVLMWIFLAGLWLVRTFKKALFRIEGKQATASRSELRRERRAA